MKKGRGVWGGSAVLSLGSIQWSSWRVGSNCACSLGLLFSLSMPLGRFILGWPCLVVITLWRNCNYLKSWTSWILEAFKADSWNVPNCNVLRSKFSLRPYESKNIHYPTIPPLLVFHYASLNDNTNHKTIRIRSTFHNRIFEISCPTNSVFKTQELWYPVSYANNFGVLYNVLPVIAVYQNPFGPKICNNCGKESNAMAPLVLQSA